MKRPKDMTIDELEALPIYAPFDCEEIPLPDPRYPDAKGSFLMRPIMKKANAYAYQRDDLLFFTDRQGQTWRLVNNDGWEKERAWI